MKQIAKFRPIVTLTSSTAILSLLAWNYFNGGVPSHNILAKADMPSISNWWGALLIPLLTWILMGRIQKRIIAQKHFETIPNYVFFGFLGGLIIGLVLAISVQMELKIISSNMIFVLFAIAIFYPIYLAECILGFVFGMTYSIGAVLPTAFALIMAAIGFLIYILIKSIRKFINSKMA